VVLHLADLTEDDEQFQTEIDVDDNGFGTVGDYLVIEGDPVYDRTRTTQVGMARGDCLIVEASETVQTLECDVSFDLDQGLITVEGPITFSEEDFDPVQEVAITGGTGAYRTARGELKIDLSDEEGFLFKFCLFL
jgi:allene oxide cyclase